MFTIGPSLYVTLFSFKRSPLNFTFFLELSCNSFETQPSYVVTELTFSLNNPFDSHEEISSPTLSKYLYTG